MNRAQHQLMTILQKINVFHGLDLGEAERLVSICKSVMFEPDTQIFKAGDLSESMLVLITGKLKAVSRTGQDLAEILPGSSIGEMGVFTGHRRSATIVAVEKSLALSMEKRNMDALLKEDAGMRVSILANVVDLLADRLAEANKQIDELRK
jgi:CRP-like cAMP-binding protein